MKRTRKNSKRDRFRSKRDRPRSHKGGKRIRKRTTTKNKLRRLKRAKGDIKLKGGAGLSEKRKAENERRRRARLADSHQIKSKWGDIWKVISDERPENRNLWFGIWHLICEGEVNPDRPKSYVLNEDKAKKVFCDPDSEYCLDWNRDAKVLRDDVCRRLVIYQD